MPTANWSVISHGGRIIHDDNLYIAATRHKLAVNVTLLLFTCMNAGSKRISFITEGLEYTEKTMGMTFPLYKNEREQRSRSTRTLGGTLNPTLLLRLIKQ